MMDENLEIKPGNETSLIIHLVLQNNILLKAHSMLMIELLCDTDEKADAATKELNNAYAKIQGEVLTHLNVLYGNVNLKDLLGDI
jgi:hypothetical protein